MAVTRYSSIWEGTGRNTAKEWLSNVPFAVFIVILSQYCADYFKGCVDNVLNNTKTSFLTKET